MRVSVWMAHLLKAEQSSSTLMLLRERKIPIVSLSHVAHVTVHVHNKQCYLVL